MTQSELHRAEPIYEELPGWWEDISAARRFDDLPAKARDYVLRLEELAGAHDFVHRRRSGTRPDHRAPRCPGGPPVTDARPEELDPEYEHHGGFPEYGAGQPGPWFRPVRGRPCGGCRIWRYPPTPATPSGTTRPTAPRRWSSCWPRFRPTRARRRPGGSPELPGMGSLLLPPWMLTRVRPRRCRNARPFHPVSRRRQLGGARRCAAAAV